MLGKVFADHLRRLRRCRTEITGSLPPSDCEAARGARGEHFGPVARFLLDRRLHAAESHEILRRDEGEDVDGAVGLGRTARGETEGDARFVGLVHDHQVDAHLFLAPVRPDIRPKGISRKKLALPLLPKRQIGQRREQRKSSPGMTCSAMPIAIKMPALSPTMEEGTLSRWLVKVGDTVKSGDIMAEIETDKATMEFEAVDEGTIADIVIRN